MWRCGEAGGSFLSALPSHTRGTPSLSLMLVALEGYYTDRLFDQRELCFEVGEGESLDLPCGLEEAIQRMEKGEHSIVYLKPR